MLRRLNKRAQSTAEYAIIIALVVGAVVAMQVYVRRGIQGRIKDVVDHVADSTDTQANDLFSNQQYEPYYATGTGTTNQNVTDTESLKEGGAVSRKTSGTTEATREQTNVLEQQQ